MGTRSSRLSHDAAASTSGPKQMAVAARLQMLSVGVSVLDKIEDLFQEEAERAAPDKKMKRHSSAARHKRAQFQRQHQRTDFFYPQVLCLFRSRHKNLLTQYTARSTYSSRALSTITKIFLQIRLHDSRFLFKQRSG